MRHVHSILHVFVEQTSLVQTSLVPIVPSRYCVFAMKQLRYPLVRRSSPIDNDLTRKFELDIGEGGLNLLRLYLLGFLS
jgi:hypothetical protein